MFKNIYTIYVMHVCICTMDSYFRYYSSRVRLLTHLCSHKSWSNTSFIVQKEHARNRLTSVKKV